MIVVGTPHGGAVLPEWLVGWERLELPPDTAVVRTLRQAVHIARNEIVATTLQRYPDATHLFFLDDDVVVPPDGLLRLLCASLEHDLPLVTGLCTQRAAPYYPCVYHQAPSGEYVHVVRFVADGGLQAVDACGAACLLVRLDVLRAIAAGGEPWFAWRDGFSEDMIFCQHARAAGFPLVLDPAVRCTHLGVLEASHALFEREWAQNGGLAFASAEVAALAQDVRPWLPRMPTTNPVT